jgi:hypothetical protein
MLELTVPTLGEQLEAIDLHPVRRWAHSPWIRVKISMTASTMLEMIESISNLETLQTGDLQKIYIRCVPDCILLLYTYIYFYDVICSLRSFVLCFAFM